MAKAELCIGEEKDTQTTAPAVGLRSISNDGKVDVSRLDRVYVPQSKVWLRKIAESAVLQGDLIVAARGSSGKAGIVSSLPSNRILCTNNVLLVRPNFDRADPTYLQAFLQDLYSNPKQDTLRRGVLGQWSITRSDLEQLKMTLPSLAEQRKIGAAFNTMHEARRAAQAVSDQYGSLLDNLSTKYFRTTSST